MHRRASLRLHVAGVHQAAPSAGEARVLHPAPLPRAGPLRHRLRDQAAQRAHAEGRRDRVRRLHPPQGALPLLRGRGAHERFHGHRQDGRQRGLHALRRIHHAQARLRQLRGRPRRDHALGRLPVARPAQAVRRRLGLGRAPRRHRRRHRRHHGHVPGERARAHLLHGALPHIQRVPGRRLRGRAAQRGAGLPRQPHLEQALRLPEGRGARHHQQARDLQRLHPGRFRGPGQDVHRACRDQVLREPQQGRARAVPQEAARQLDHLQLERREQPHRGRPPAVRRALPHRPLAHARHVGDGPAPRPPELGRVRARRHRREPQLPKRRRLGVGRQDEPLPAAHGEGHQAGREDQGADAVRHAREQPLPRPAQPARPGVLGRPRRLVREAAP